MSLLFRKVRESRWYTAGDAAEFAWLPASDAQADALDDLRTKSNALSVFVINEDRSNLERVATAFAASGDELTNIDYAIFDDDVLHRLGVPPRPEPGRTPDAWLTICIGTSSD